MTTPSPSVELTRDLVRYDTINPPGNEEPCVRHVGTLLEDAGFRVSYHPFAPGRASLVASAGSGSRPPLCFTGHLDTVPLGQRAWRVDPLGGEIEDGRIHGRGTTDMKGGVAAFVTAAIRAMAGECEPELLLVITAGEETGAEGAAHLAAEPGALGRPGAIVVGEPTANVPLLGHKGAMWLTARCAGVSAHGSTPERGVNAVYKAGHILGRLERVELEAREHPGLGKLTLNVGTITGGMNINSVPDRAEIGIDVRTLPGMDHGELRTRLEELLSPDLDELRSLVDLAGLWTDAEDPWVQAALDVVGTPADDRARPAGASYFTDASVLTPACGMPPTIVLGPGDPAMAHQTDEYCEVARIDAAETMYAALMARW